MKAPSAALRAKGFRRLAFSYTVNDLGDTFGLVALAVLVLEQTDSALGTTALFVAGRFVPAFLAPLLTARIDRAPPQRVLGVLYAIEALAFAGLSWLATDFVLGPVLALALVDGTLAITARGVSRGAIANTLESEGALRSGNAIINALFSASSVVGPVLGGVVTAAAGASTALAIDAGSFAVIALVLAAAPLPHPSHEDAPGWVARLREGLAEVSGRPQVRRLVTAQGAALVFFTLIAPIEVVYATRAHWMPERSATASCSGPGGWACSSAPPSSRVAGRVRWRCCWAPRPPRSASAISAWRRHPGSWLRAPRAWSVALGTASSGSRTSPRCRSARPRGLQARIGGLMESIGAAAPGLGYLLGGLLTAAVSTRLAFVVAGAGALLLAPLLGRAAADSPES